MQEILHRWKRKPAQEAYLIAMFAGIGDVVFALEIIQKIRRFSPDASISIFATPPQEEVLQVYSDIHTIPVQEGFFAKSSEGRSERRRFVEDGNRKKYDVLFARAPRYSLQLRETARKTPLYFPMYRMKLLSQLGIKYTPTPQYIGTRNYVDQHFTGKTHPDTYTDRIPLPLTSAHILQARHFASQVKEAAGLSRGKLVIVAPDTSSFVTRPPHHILAQGVAGALRQREDIVVGILPSYTFAQAAPALLARLREEFGERVQSLEKNDRLPLPMVAALIDQADTFVVGDTGLMHLSVTDKFNTQGIVAPRNQTAVITLWGGTDPRYYGYSCHSTIIGAGNVFQMQFSPGIDKRAFMEMDLPYFDHIDPGELTEALLRK